MAGLINALINILNEQTKNYSELLTLSKEKKDYIVKNDIKALQEVVAKENLVIGKNQRLDRKRIETVKDIAVVLNKKESEITITGLADMLQSQPEREPLIQAVSELRSVSGELKEINDQNNVLIQNALEYIDFSINLMRSAHQSAPAVYSRKGEEIDTGRSIFDAKQ